MKVKDMGFKTQSPIAAYATALRFEAEVEIAEGRDSLVHPRRALCWDCGTYHELDRECIFLGPEPEAPKRNPYADTLRDMIANIQGRDDG